MLPPLFLRIYLGCGLVVWLSLFALVWTWFPAPHTWLSGGYRFMLTTLLCGAVLVPLGAWLLQRRRRATREMAMDVVGIMLIHGAVWGALLFLAAQSRPVALVFEYRLFRVVHANEVATSVADLWRDTRHGEARVPLRALREFVSAQEKLDLTLAALDGVPLAVRSDMWIDYPAQRDHVLRSAAPLAQLAIRFPEVTRAQGVRVQPMVYVPVVGRSATGVALLDPQTAEVLQIIQLDPFAETMDVRGSSGQ